VTTPPPQPPQPTQTRPARPFTVALVAGPDPGHALPVLGLGAELVRRGHRVRVWTGQQHAQLAAAHGITWHRLPLLAPQPGDEDLGQRLWGRAGPMARALLPPVVDAAVDLVVVDTLTKAGSLVAGLLDRPHVEVVPHHLADPAEDLPPVGLGRPLARTPWRRHDDRQLVAAQLASAAEGDRQAAAAARAVGLPAWPLPAARLLQTLPSLERIRRWWPEDAHVVGPLALDPDLPPLAPPDGDAPLVVITDSTATEQRRSIGELALRALAYLDVRIVVTSTHLPARREARTVVGVGPHGPLLAVADVVVSPGGGGVVTKAAAAGVPHVVVPLAGDQREAAARIRDVGAGRVVSASRCTPRRLRHAVVSTLADSRARKAAGRLAVEAGRLGPPVAAAHCEAVVRREGPPT
jgi:UDP:flavonoid glycosyltransferase YjiC (YdhE family)